MMDINYGDRMEYLASVSSDDFTMARMVERLAAGDEAWKPYTGKDYRGNINTTIIRTRRGRTIMVQHDTSSPRPGVRFHLISCTKDIYEESHPPASRIVTGHEGWMPKEKLESLTDKYIPEMMKRYNEFMSQATSVETQRGGYYRVMPLDWRIVDCLRNGLPMEMDVYEAAASSSIIPLSEWSVANGSAPVRVPDFTCGAWETNDRGMDIELQRGGGTTRLV
jgi:hypothetical protein